MSTVEPTPGTKRCPRCGETKPLDAFNRDARRRDGRRPECRDCERAAKRERANKGMCRDCNKPAAPGLSRCAEHLVAYAARDRARRKARIAGGRCLEFGCQEPRLPDSVRCAAHREANRAHARARIASGSQAAAQRAWRERNRAAGWCYIGGRSHGPATRGVLCARCRARTQARHRKTMIEFTAILSDQGVDHDGRCELCGLAEATQVDHVRPRSHGGPDDDPLLLRWVCGTCNASRGNNTAWVPPLTAWDIEEQLSREEGR